MIEAAEEAAEVPSPPSANPTYTAPFAVNIAFPKEIEIKMVDASVLSDYEFGLGAAAFFLNVSVGFVVSYVQGGASDGVLLTVALISSAATIGAFVWGLMKRRKMKVRSKTFKLRTSDVEEMRS